MSDVDGTPKEQQNRSADLIIAFFRGVVARAKGLEYSRTFNKVSTSAACSASCDMIEVIYTTVLMSDRKLKESDRLLFQSLCMVR